MQITTREKVLLLGSLANMLRQGEALADAPEIVLPIARNGVDQAQLHWQMRGTSEQNTIAIQELSAKRSGDLLYLTWQIGKDFYAVPGLLHLTLVGKDGAGNVTVKYMGDTPLMVFPVEEGQYDPPEGILEHCMDQVEAAKGYAQNAAASAQKAEAEGQKKVAEAAAQADRAEAAADRAECKIDDTKATTHTAYSSLFADDRYCPPIHAGPAPIVQMHDVLGGYPMQVVTHIEPVQEGSGEPSPDNIRQITATTSVTIALCGANIVNTNSDYSLTNQGITFKRQNGKITLSGTSTGRARMQLPSITLPPNADFFVSIRTEKFVGAENENVFFQFDVYEGGKWKKAIAVNPKKNGHAETTQQVKYSGKVTLKPSVIVENGASVNGSFFASANFGIQAVPYFPYQGQNYTVQFGQTVYGGEFEWEKGNLITKLNPIVLRSLESLPESISSIRSIDEKNGFVRIVANLKHDKTAVSVVGQKCSHLKYEASFANFSPHFYVETNALVFFLPLDILPNSERINDRISLWLKNQSAAGSPVTFIYESAPEENQFAPQEIISQQCSNTIYSTIGKTEIFARKDLIVANQSLERRIAELESKLNQI